MKIRVLFLYGGDSVEHEISIISALQAMDGLDTERYEAIPCYISKQGDMYGGEHLRKLAHSLITSRITTLVLNEYPNARWIWEAPNAFELIELGEEVYILLNRAGGYRKAKVIIQNLQVIGLQYQEIPKKPDESEERTEAPATEQPKENYELIAFEWAESHIFELNARCNDAIGQGLTEIILTADDLPARESWENVCLELQRAGLEDVECIAEGIKINLSH